MLIQFTTSSSPCGTLSYNNLDKLRSHLATRDPHATLLLADVNSLYSVPDFLLYCKKANLENYLVGSRLMLKIGDGEYSVTAVAKDNKGFQSISKLLSSIPSDIYLSANHRFELQEISQLEGVSFIFDKHSPSLTVAQTLKDSGLDICLQGETYTMGEANPPYEVENAEFERVGLLNLTHIGEKDRHLAQSRFDYSFPDWEGQGFFHESSSIDKISYSNIKPSSLPKALESTKGLKITPNNDVNSSIGVDYKAKVLAKIDELYPFGHKDREKYLDRLKLESDIIEKTGATKYFELIVAFAKYCSEKDVPLTLRGSAASSLILHLNGLTPSELDPVKLNLDLRRFIGYHRVGNEADVDIEIPQSHVGIFEEFTSSTQNGLTAVSISVPEKFSRFKTSLEQVLKMRGTNESSSRHLVDSIYRKLKSSGLIGGFYEFKNLRNKKFIDSIKDSKYGFTDQERSVLKDLITINGWTTNIKVHQSKRVVQNINDSAFPVTLRDGSYIVHLHKDNCEKFNQIPFDMISSQISSDLMKVDKVILSEGLDSIAIDGAFEDGNAYFQELFEKLPASTNMINQLSSSFATGKVVEYSPKNYQDLSAVFAYIRPAVDDEDENAEEYLNEKNGVKVNPLKVDPTCVEILARTRGEFIYDEQILEIATQVGGLSDQQGDQLRTAIRKTRPEILDELKPHFINGAQSLGRDRQFAESLYDKVSGYMGKYFFNESHAMSYTVIALKQMVLKDKYPALFYQFCVKEHDFGSAKPMNRFYLDEKTKLSSKQERVYQGYLELKSNGFNFDRVSINNSKSDVFWSDTDDSRHIYPSLVSACGNKQVSDAIVSARGMLQSGRFETVMSFIDTFSYESQEIDDSIVMDSVTKLSKMGAFDGIPLLTGVDLSSSVEDLTVQRAICASYIRDSLKCKRSGVEYDYAINVSPSDVLDYKDLMVEEIKAYGYSTISECIDKEPNLRRDYAQNLKNKSIKLS